MIMKKALPRFLAVVALCFACRAPAQVEYVDPSMGGQGFMLEPIRPVDLPPWEAKFPGEISFRCAATLEAGIFGVG